MKWYAAYLATVLTLLAASPLRAESARGLAVQGNARYRAGKFADSLKLYQQAAAKAPNSPEILYDLGNARYRLNDLEGAAKAYQQAAILSRDSRLTAQSEFNLGDTLFRQGEALEANNPDKAIKKYQESISQFRAALSQDPDLSAAGRNLELGKRRLAQAEERLKKRQEDERLKQEEREKLARKLGRMADRQDDLARRSRELTGQPPAKGQAASQAEAEGQKGLAGQTKELEKQLGQAGGKGQAAGQAVQQAEQAQSQAGDELRAGQPAQAAASQAQAANSLREAKEKLSGREPHPAPERQGQGRPGQPGDKAGVKPQPGAKDSPAAAPKGDKPPAGAAQSALKAVGQGAEEGGPGGQTAKDILAQEQRDMLNRQRQNNRAGGAGYAPVARDW